MSYADRLKAEIGAKVAPSPTDKTDKTPFVSYVSSKGEAFSPIARARFWRFMVCYADGRSFEARTLPEATEAEARELWPGANVEPMAERESAAPIHPGDLRELHYLLGLSIGRGSPEYDDALTAALVDPGAALCSLRADWTGRAISGGR